MAPWEIAAREKFLAKLRDDDQKRLRAVAEDLKKDLFLTTGQAKQASRLRVIGK